jgi:Pilus assembly protein, PilO
MMEISRDWLRAGLRMLREKRISLGVVARGAEGRQVDSQRFDARCLMRRAPVLLGWPGMVGIGLLTGCVAFYFSAIQDAQDRLTSARTAALALHEQSKLAGHGQAGDQGTPEEQLAQFFRNFPRDKDVPQCMEKIFAAARSDGIELEKGEYKATQDKEGGVVRFEMTFPVKGDYPRIRKYLSSLMTDMPTLSLQQVKFKRQKVGDAAVEANISFVLFLREQKS